MDLRTHTHTQTQTTEIRTLDHISANTLVVILWFSKMLTLEELDKYTHT